jgi:glycosyltransferase involved in cell wall biosynthesis
MKVLILTHEFPPYDIGGMGTFINYLARALARSGMEVTVAAGTPSRFLRVSHNDTITIRTDPSIIRVVKIRVPPAHLWYQVMNFSALRRLFAGFDLIHGQDCNSFPLIYFSKKDHRDLPWVVTFHTGVVSEFYSALQSFGRGGFLSEFLRNGVGFPAWDVLVRGEVRFADAIVPVSENLSVEMEKCYGVDERRLFPIVSGVDIERLESIAQSVCNCHESERVRLFWGGRLIWRKGILHLLNALSHLIHVVGFRDFELQVFGSGPLERRVRELVSELGLSGNVRIRGFVKYEELIANMALSDVVCFPSLYEACPSGMMEAISLGKPVLAFRTVFARELLGQSYPLQLATSTDDYARCLHLLCSSENLRHECELYLRTRGRRHFDIRVTAEKYSNLYRRLPRVTLDI